MGDDEWGKVIGIGSVAGSAAAHGLIWKLLLLCPRGVAYRAATEFPFLELSQVLLSVMCDGLYRG